MKPEFDLGLFQRRRIRHVRQTELAECGLACLSMIATYHGLAISLAVLRRRFTPSTRGVSLQSLIDSSYHLGLDTRAVKVDLDELRYLKLPAILHWDMDHYVVLERLNRFGLLIHNPASGSSWMPMTVVSQHFTGVALELAPAPDFQIGEASSKLRLRTLWSRVSGLKRAISQTIILSLLLQIFSLIMPYYLQITVDSVLPELNIGFISVLAFGFIIVAISSGVTALLRSAVLLSMGSSFGYGLSSNIARKLLRLQVDWYSKRRVGDILSRFQSIIPIRKMLTEDAPAAFLDGALAILTITLMIAYSTQLSFVSLISISLIALLRIILYKPQRDAQEELIIAVGREQSLLIESLRGIRPLRLAGGEMFRHSMWQSRMVDVINGSARYQRLINWQTHTQTAILAIENVISVWIAVGIVIRGGFSTGMIFAFLAYKAQFFTAALSLMAKLNDFRLLDLHLERLSDIVLSPDDVAFKQDEREARTLKGEITLHNVKFRYTEDDPFILKGVDVTISEGEFIAITGASGGGKSTLVNIILGLFFPTDGMIHIDGMELNKFGYKNYRSQTAAVLQDDALFSGSLADNISLFEEKVDFDFLRECAKAAGIHDDIVMMPMGYNTLVGELGHSLSGGQRQRILLARALYRKPRLLIMDEGTSQLDTEKELEINASIKN
ncbi:peptidase domain-containing ABC transporter [Sphingobium sp. Sx8-8]|uniref:peptidase domain-containing ABC transporter n=1 Tax=Sphingobium sp. Sx8-8 TaxID=2933617 RepID=UPI002479333E|nr:peptidase domain-containing ABC transporter [Sphingobium sp. Sx8-8]